MATIYYEQDADLTLIQAKKVAVIGYGSQAHAQALNLRHTKTLMFSPGFNIRFVTIQPPPEVDVSMVAPKAPGHRVRETFQEGEGTPALLAVHQDSTGKAKALARPYHTALGPR